MLSQKHDHSGDQAMITALILFSILLVALTLVFEALFYQEEHQQ